MIGLFYSFISVSFFDIDELTKAVYLLVTIIRFSYYNSNF